MKSKSMKLGDSDFYSINEHMKLIIRHEPTWITNQELHQKRQRIQVLLRVGIIIGISILIWLQAR